MSANLENSAVAKRLEKVSFHSNLKEQCQKTSNYGTIALVHTLAKKKKNAQNSQARLQQYMNRELSDV